MTAGVYRLVGAFVIHMQQSQNSLRCGSNYYHGVLRRAYFDGFQIVGVCFIAEFSFPFCCFVLTRPKKKRRI